MARYELILRLDGALWLRIIFNPLLTQKGAIKIKKRKVLKSVPNQPSKSLNCRMVSTGHNATSPAMVVEASRRKNQEHHDCTMIQKKRFLTPHPSG